MIFDSIVSDIIASIIAGAILALLFFWMREKYFALPDIAGRWYFEMHTINTLYLPYKGMVLRYVAILYCEGNRVQGTVEKIYEDSSTGKREYIGNNRTRGIVEGYLEKKYFSKDRIFLHVVEEGHGRESTNYHDVTIKTNENMDGKFISMVAGQDGNVIWQREEF
jgi:hypothetical protein